jgi:hypothetical protein
MYEVASISYVTFESLLRFQESVQRLKCRVLQCHRNQSEHWHGDGWWGGGGGVCECDVIQCHFATSTGAEQECSLSLYDGERE